MQERKMWSAALIIAAGLFVGCDNSETKPASSAAPAAPAKTPSAEVATDSAKDPATDTAAAVPAKAEEAAAKTEEAATEAAGDVQAKATELLGQVTTYVKENKMDLAEKSLIAAEKLKPQLPESFHGQIDKARTMFDGAKKTNEIKNLGGSLLGK